MCCVVVWLCCAVCCDVLSFFTLRAVPSCANCVHALVAHDHNEHGGGCAVCVVPVGSGRKLVLCVCVVVVGGCGGLLCGGGGQAVNKRS